MKKIVALSVLLALTMVVGCSGGKKPSASSSVTDVAPPPPPQHTAVTATPVTITPPADDPVMAAPVGGGAPAAGRSYTVKKGDTLWNIAQRAYGDGQQWKRIVSANPSIKGDKVMVGQTINLP